MARNRWAQQELDQYVNGKGLEYARYLISKGVPQMAAASIAGNIYQESRGDPQNRTGAYKGLLQMGGARLASMHKFIGGDYRDPFKQLDFYKQEMTNPKGDPDETRPGRRVMESRNIREAQDHMRGYLRYNTRMGNEATRMAAAQGILDKIRDGVMPAPAGQKHEPANKPDENAVKEADKKTAASGEKPFTKFNEKTQIGLIQAAGARNQHQANKFTQAERLAFQDWLADTNKLKKGNGPGEFPIDGKFGPRTEAQTRAMARDKNIQLTQTRPPHRHAPQM